VAAIIVFTLLAWSVAGTGASLPALVEGLPAMGDYLRRLLPSEGRPWPLDYLPRIVEPLVQTVKVAFAASVIGSALALPFALVGTRTLAPGRTVYNLSRSFLNFCAPFPIWCSRASSPPRSDWARCPACWPWSCLPSAWSQNSWPIRWKRLIPARWRRSARPAARACSAPCSQRFPRLVPDFVAYALYAFEINVRVAAVLGFVGAGGIGEVLVADLRLARYGRVGMVIVLTFLLVLVIDSVSTC
jgi:phosphonate transport system permease protein